MIVGLILTFDTGGEVTFHALDLRYASSEEAAFLTSPPAHGLRNEVAPWRESAPQPVNERMKWR